MRPSEDCWLPGARQIAVENVGDAGGNENDQRHPAQPQAAAEDAPANKDSATTAGTAAMRA